MTWPRIACALVLACLAGCDEQAPEGPSAADTAKAAQRAIAGIPQKGRVLGRATAPVTLRMFASVGDLNRGFLENDLPVLGERYLRKGRLKLSLEPVSRATLGDPVATRLTRLALATGLQDRLWSFYVTFGSLSDGSLSAARQQQALELVPAVDAEKARAAARTDAVTEQLRQSDAALSADRPLPSFVLTAPGVAPVPVPADCAGCLLDRLDAALHKLDGARARARAQAKARAKAAKAKARAKAKAQARARAKAQARARAKAQARRPAPAPPPAATRVPTPAPTRAPAPPPPPAPTPQRTPEPQNTIFPSG